MAAHHKVLIGLQVVFAWFMLAGSPSFAQKATPKNTETIVPTNDVPWQVESKALQLMHEFDKPGYEVLRGYFKLLSDVDCPVSYEVMNTCYGNNPAAPYVIPIVPPWPNHPGPGEFVDEAMTNALGFTAAGYNGSYRLDPHEALVILAQMPPPAAYFSVQTYLFTRAGELKTDSLQYKAIEYYFPYLIPTFFTAVPHEPAETPRVELISDLSDANNSVVIKKSSHSVWEQLRYFIVTPNPAMDAAVRAAFAKIGVADNDIYTEKIPNHLGPPVEPPKPDDSAVRIGLGQQADDFVTVIRYAMPQAKAAAERWRQEKPMVVLRVRNLAAEEQTYDWVGFEERKPSQPPETWYNEQPHEYLTTLAQAVCERWNQPGCVATDFVNLQVQFYLTGPDCILAWMNCIAPGEDSTYLFSGKLPLLHSYDVYAVVGPLSTATDNATYVGLGLNLAPRQVGFDNISGEELAHSAFGYSKDVPADKFFVHYFARDCTGLETKTGGHCYSVGDKVPENCFDKADNSCDMLNLSLRAYIRPGTQRATDATSVLKSKFILLDRRIE